MEESIKGIWEVFDLEANRKIQKMLLEEKHAFRFYANPPPKQLMCKREQIEEKLKTLDFVKWDRYFTYPDGLSVFGWIDRKDEKKDFVLLEFIGDSFSFATSSKIYSRKIAELFNIEHSDCQRVEGNFRVDNVIKLKEDENAGTGTKR